MAALERGRKITEPIFSAQLCRTVTEQLTRTVTEQSRASQHGLIAAVHGEMGGREIACPPVPSKSILFELTKGARPATSSPTVTMPTPCAHMPSLHSNAILLPSGATLEIMPSTDAGPLAELFLASLHWHP